MTDAEAIRCAEALRDFCAQQKGCQNCVFRMLHGDHWNCHIDEGLISYDDREVLANYDAKRKNHGYI